MFRTTSGQNFACSLFCAYAGRIDSPDDPADVRRREIDSPAGSNHDVVERTLIGPGVVFAADLTARAALGGDDTLRRPPRSPT